MRAVLFLLLSAVLAVGTDAVLFNGTYSQAVWQTLSQYTVEVRGVSGPPAPVPPPAGNHPSPG